MASEVLLKFVKAISKEQREAKILDKVKLIDNWKMTAYIDK